MDSNVISVLQICEAEEDYIEQNYLTITLPSSLYKPVIGFNHFLFTKVKLYIGKGILNVSIHDNNLTLTNSYK